MPKIYIAGQELGGLSGHEAGRLLLGALYREHAGGELPQIRITDGGKPYFADSTWYFSISHTKSHAFCALSDTPIGIDAEEMDRKIDLRIAPKILSPHELAQYEAAVDKQRTLLSFWVLKEAEAKLSGKGIRTHPNHTQFTLPDPRVREHSHCLLAVMW